MLKGPETKNGEKQMSDGYFPNSLWPNLDIYVLGQKTKSIFPWLPPTHSVKIVLIIWPKIPQMPQNLSSPIPRQSPEVWFIIDKWFHRAFKA